MSAKPEEGDAPLMTLGVPLNRLGEVPRKEPFGRLRWLDLDASLFYERAHNDVPVPEKLRDSRADVYYAAFS